MLRRVFTSLSVLSLMLCAATGFLWMRSLGTVDQLVRWGPVDRRVESDRGRLLLVEFPYHSEGPSVRWEFRSYIPDADDLWTLDDVRTIDRYVQRPDSFHYDAFGFSIGRGAGPMAHMNWVVIPHWFIMLCGAALPLFAALRRLRSRQRSRAVLCRACGYDLRVTPARCPECGTRRGKQSDFKLNHHPKHQAS